jgi:hypothetical protein
MPVRAISAQRRLLEFFVLVHVPRARPRTRSGDHRAIEMTDDADCTWRRDSYRAIIDLELFKAIRAPESRQAG